MKTCRHKYGLTLIYKLIITRLYSRVKRQAQTRNKLKITFKILHNNYIPLFTNTILTLKLARFLRLSTHHFSHHAWNPESTALESRIQDCLGNLYMGQIFSQRTLMQHHYLVSFLCLSTHHLSYYLYNRRADFMITPTIQKWIYGRVQEHNIIYQVRPISVKSYN